MPRFFLRLSFKGTAYSGWQIQDNAVSVQEKLNHALSTIFRREVSTIGCGRTDTGVHARQFYAHFDHPSDIDDPGKICVQLNGILPFDISVHELIPVESDHHARFDASSRTYEYFISTNKNAFLKEYAMLQYIQPDMAKMEHACTYLLKQSDFSSFSKSRTQVKTNICHITRAEWTLRNGLLIFTISADRFLRGMVRAIVGTMLEAGLSKIDPEELLQIIEKKDRTEAGASVPACGLYLSQIDYPFIPVSAPFKFPA